MNADITYPLILVKSKTIATLKTLNSPKNVQWPATAINAHICRIRYPHQGVPGRLGGAANANTTKCTRQ